MQARDTDRLVRRPGGATRRRRTMILVLLATLVLAAILLWLESQWLRPPDDTATPRVPRSPAATVDTMHGATPSTPGSGQTATRELTTDSPLPPPSGNDEEVRQELAALLPPTLHPSLAPENLLARSVAVIESLSHGRLVRDKLPLPPVPGKLLVIERDGHVYLDPANHARYEMLVDAIGGIDADTLSSWYLRHEPLLQRAYRELGNGNAHVRNALLDGIATMLAAPPTPETIRLIQPAVFYRFADPALEALPDTQKLLLRIGPRNRLLIEHQLAAFAALLRQAPEPAVD